MFKDAFSALNSNYPQGAGAVEALSNNPSDKGLLTGLADFKASIKQAVDSSNPMRPSEVDSFSYNVSQKTQVNGRSSADRSVTQNQQSVLSASFHKGLDGGKPPVLMAVANHRITCMCKYRTGPAAPRALPIKTAN